MKKTKISRPASSGRVSPSNRLATLVLPTIIYEKYRRLAYDHRRSVSAEMRIALVAQLRSDRGDSNTNNA